MINVLIVEDEIILRQGILSLINWGKLDCSIIGECSNGLDALEVLKNNKVDLIITDIRMPIMSGLELCENIYNNYPHTQIIILSAFSDFTYAQEAIKYNVIDYIVKSQFVKELPDAVEKARKIIYEYQTSNNNLHETQDMEKLKPILIKNILLDPSNNYIQNKQLWEMFGTDYDNYYIVLTEIGCFQKPEEVQKIQNSIKQFYNLSFQEFNNVSVWLDSNYLLCIIGFPKDNTGKNSQLLIETCNQMLSTISNFTPFKVNIGISSKHTDKNKLKTSYKEASHALNNILNENSVSIYESHPNVISASSLPDSLKTASKFTEYIYSKDRASYLSYLGETLKNYQHSIADFNQIKTKVLITISRCCRSISEKDINIDSIDSIEKNINERILVCKSLNQLYSLLIQFYDDIVKLNIPSSNYNYLVHKVNSYIKEHYNSPIKLDDIAGYLHVNSSYLSRLYKQQVGDSIITVLNKYRIEKAKELLKNENYLVSEVGALVGIKDPAYFTSVFTKYTGISPKNYK
ncbi:hypothetical protein SH2C18_38850 [Clostridium sediminicola]|uniref:response regulator n=1 Tax=Clostridium sediminicola TaxID=3114879 RepID=UPI0031F216F7